MAAIFNFSLIRTSGSARSSLVVLPDLENMGMAVGSSLLSCIEAETYVISRPLPVNGRHPSFSSSAMTVSGLPTSVGFGRFFS